MTRLIFIVMMIFCSCIANAQKKTKSNNLPKEVKKDLLDPALFSGLKFRSIGPAITSGRIADIAVNPGNSSQYYVAAASGGVWKTNNAGITFTPVFDGEGSYSIGCLAIDPLNPAVVWVGSGENNNQRSVAYGDGIYKSEDAGKSWKNMGLKNSEHIGRIAIDPTNSDIVYVAAYGPLWNSGGDRGIYKTIDGGLNWKQVLKVSEYTGFNEVMLDPRHPEIIYAAAHQRQRKVFTYIGGGPESALYKSTDGGANWNKIMKGLPAGEIGRIGINYSPVNPDILYAVVEANDGDGGVYKSNDRGASWEKQGPYATAGNYYQKIYCDPKDVNKIFVMNTYLGVSKDAGKTFSNLGEKSKHIDNHAIWIDPQNTNHYLVGCDGGLYESYDAAENWQFKSNLPITQFYKVATDNSLPFYHVHGGTQDNFSLGGPSRTTSINGVASSDWYFTSIGDGFETQVDPTDPNIIYAQSQYGGLVRFDKKSGEFLDIKPIEMEGEEAYRWNWDSPLLISKYDHKRLYFAGNRLFRSDNGGSGWKAISGTLSRNIDRNKFMVMDKVWSMDAIAKNTSTDMYGNITSIAESQFDQQILFAGTDDGLIQLTTDGGKNWKSIDMLTGIPERSYVNQIITSLHDKNTVYAVFNHHRYGDFHPYIMKTTDLGNTWKPIHSNLPERGSVYTIAEDHVNKNLLFAGTEFGVFVSLDGGLKWNQLKGGLPTIATRDMEIQRRENDLVLATFGRGFYILDDYTALRTVTPDSFKSTAIIFPVKDALMFVGTTPLGVRGKGFQGESFYTATNPKSGAVFTYYLKEDIKTLKEKRKEDESEKFKNKMTVYYPSKDSIRMEDMQVAPHLLFIITDDKGNEVRRLKAAAKKGMNRITWDLRYAPFGPVDLSSFDESYAFNSPETGYMVSPGMYKIAMHKFEDGKYTELVSPVAFNVKALNNSSIPPTEIQSAATFSKQLAELRRVSAATDEYRSEMMERIKYIKQAVIVNPQLSLSISETIFNIERRLNEVNIKLNGDASLSRREFETYPSVNSRIGGILGGLWNTSSAPTQTYIQSFELAKKEFSKAYQDIKSIASDLNQLEQTLELKHTQYTPGRLPEWPAGEDRR